MHSPDRVDTPGPPPTSPGFVDLVARTRGVQPWRRVFHALSGVGLAVVPASLGFSGSTTALVLGGITAVVFALDALRLRYPRLNRAFFTWFSSMASPREAAGFASSSWYALGATAVYAFFTVPVAAASMLVLALADPAASVVGRIWGTTPLGKGSRLGAATFTAVAWGCLVVALPGWPPWPLLGIAALVAAAEVLPTGVDDNLSVPVVTGVLLWALNALFV